MPEIERDCYGNPVVTAVEREQRAPRTPWERLDATFRTPSAPNVIIRRM